MREPEAINFFVPQFLCTDILTVVGAPQPGDPQVRSNARVCVSTAVELVQKLAKKVVSINVKSRF